MERSDVRLWPIVKGDGRSPTVEEKVRIPLKFLCVLLASILEVSYLEAHEGLSDCLGLFRCNELLQIHSFIPLQYQPAKKGCVGIYSCIEFHEGRGFAKLLKLRMIKELVSKCNRKIANYMQIGFVRRNRIEKDVEYGHGIKGDSQTCAIVLTPATTAVNSMSRSAAFSSLEITLVLPFIIQANRQMLAMITNVIVIAIPIFSYL